MTYVQIDSPFPHKGKLRIHCVPDKRCSFNGNLKGDYIFKKIRPALGDQLVKPHFRERGASFESAKFPGYFWMLEEEGGKKTLYLRKVDMSSKEQSKYDYPYQRGKFYLFNRKYLPCED